MTTPLEPGTRIVAGAFTLSGVMHLVRPQVFEPVIPTPLRTWDTELVVLSGVAELLCAAGLAVPATRAAAGVASVALLAAVFPANVQMAIDHTRRARRRPTAGRVAVAAGTWARLPLQWTMVRAVARAGR
ncbi:DoxX family protein [Kytococcus sedentarius]|uniref:DoxX family protein n=1 Tax=Kytococcus sedentarius TaxID=1276 RepID=UPI0035BC3664